MNHQQIAYLCGYFTRCNDIFDEQLSRQGWQREQLDTDKIEGSKRVFYPEFVDFCYGGEVGCTAYTLPLNKQLALEFRGQHYDYQLLELALYLMPQQMVLFSVKISQEADDLNAFTATLFSLRAIDYYTPDVHQSFIDTAINPLKTAYQQLTGSMPDSLSALVENGNKLRVYQVINTADATLRPEDDEARSMLLYQLGTLSKVTKDGETDEYSVAEDYLKRIMDENRITVFRNWDALALMDTFTMHAYGLSPGIIDNWQGTYFRMIYLHALFQKCYLFNLNARFRQSLRKSLSPFARLRGLLNVSNSEIGELTEEYEQFERWCCFHKISYNFLPLELNEAIDKGLEIGEEQEQLAGVLEKEKNRRDAANDKMVNTLLFCLSILTLASAIWDLTCLLDQMYPYSDYLGSTILGYRTVTLLVLLLLGGVLYLLFHRKKK